MRRLIRDRSAVSVLEFALALPPLLGFALSGLEMASYILTNNTTQRMATMVADLVAQSGVGDVAATEAQIYDMFYAIDVAAKPLSLRKNGRVMFSVIKGVTQSDGTVRNEYADTVYAQQFDGNYVAAVPVLGCQTTTPLPNFARSLPANELMVHAQVTYVYEPLFAKSAFSYFDVPTVLTRTATFRMRKNRFNISNDGSHPAKTKCATSNGL